MWSLVGQQDETNKIEWLEISFIQLFWLHLQNNPDGDKEKEIELLLTKKEAKSAKNQRLNCTVSTCGVRKQT